MAAETGGWRRASKRSVAPFHSSETSTGLHCTLPEQACRVRSRPRARPTSPRRFDIALGVCRDGRRERRLGSSSLVLRSAVLKRAFVVAGAAPDRRELHFSGGGFALSSRGTFERHATMH
eukprot:scaffold120185_cov58-Phaeocystis_antarctica.AAC.1